MDLLRNGNGDRKTCSMEKRDSSSIMMNSKTDKDSIICEHRKAQHQKAIETSHPLRILRKKQNFRLLILIQI
jgi:hypothetical protein